MIQEILDLLPIELTEDIYFQNLKAIIVDNFKDFQNQLILKVQVNEEIYNKIPNKDLFVVNNKLIMSFMFRVDDAICSLGIKKDGDSYYVYYERKSFAKLARTILIKSVSGVIIETKEVLKENGIYKKYDSNVYCYDDDYEEINFDKEETLDKKFSDEFGISLKLAHIMRKDFSKYALFLSILASEQKMKNRDNKLNEIDFFQFRGPWEAHIVEECIESEYNKERSTIIKKTLNQTSNNKHINNMLGISKIILWLKMNLDNDSEFVISNNIYVNLVPILTGEDALGFNTKGYIIEKANDNYFIYKVHFRTNKITFKKEAITLEDAQTLFFSNQFNLNNDGLKAFFGISRGR